MANEMVEVDGGELVTQPTQEINFDALLIRDGVFPPDVTVRCSYDKDSDDGRLFMERALSSLSDEKGKLATLNKSFMMVAFTSAIRIQLKDKKTGTLLPEPRAFIRTVVECEDGTTIAFCSSHVYQDISRIHKNHPVMGVGSPVECTYYKGGDADRVKDTVACAPRKVAKKGGDK